MEVKTDHLSSLFEHATEGFVITDSRGKIFLLNPSACRMFGYEPRELIGKEIEILLPAAMRGNHVKLRDGFYKEPGNRVMGHGRDLQAARKDGRNFPVEVSLSTYIYNGERYATAFIIDISRRKEIEGNILRQQEMLAKVTDEMRLLNADLEIKVEERTAILKEALQRLEQSQQELHEALKKERELHEMKSRFVSMASHEFRTPLSTVLSSASLLGKYEKTEEQDKRLRHVEKIKGAVSHLNSLLEDFLSLGRLDEGKAAPAFREFDLTALLQETIAELKPLAKKDQRLILDHEGSCVLETDRNLVKNILINLLSNAIKFSGEGQLIRLHAGAEAGHAVIQVSDQGIGIPAEDQPQLFSSFFRGSNALNIQGTGLGLHIVRRYAALLHGNISLESSLGEGTTVTVSIPFKTA